MLISKIRQASQGEQKAMLDLIQQFNPLLYKYARKLNYSDAYYDLRLYFIDLILDLGKNKIDIIKPNYVLSYIEKAVLHSYCKLLRKRHISVEDIPFSNFTEEQQYALEVTLIYEDDKEESEDLFFEELKAILTDSEYKVIKKMFMQSLSMVDIAKECAISKQGVDNTRKRAFNKIKRWLNEKAANY